MPGFRQSQRIQNRLHLSNHMTGVLFKEERLAYETERIALAAIGLQAC